MNKKDVKFDQELVLYHHWRFRCLNKLAITIVHHDYAIFILALFDAILKEDIQIMKDFLHFLSMVKKIRNNIPWWDLWLSECQ